MRRFVCLSLMIIASVAVLPAASETVPSDRLLNMVGALSDNRTVIHEPAMIGLVQIGDSVLPDLEVLVADPSADVRARVATVTGNIGGPKSYKILLRLSQDRDAYVREVAVLGLGRTATRKAYSELAPLLRDPIPGVRESAALALGSLNDPRAIADLTLWPEAGGARANLRLKNPPEDERQIRRIQKAMQASLKHLVMRPSGIPFIAKELPTLPGYRQVTLLEMTWEIGDARLSPTIAELLSATEVDVRRAAATALAANGDGRALGALCAVAAADSSPSVRDAAANTLRRLTGHQAGPGPAWRLWWRNHQASVETLAERDAFIAQLYDPQFSVTAADLARFSPRQLMPLIDGVMGSGAPWWPSRAWALVQMDDSTRWTDVLLDRYRRAWDEREQVAIVVLLDELGDPAAQPALEQLLAQVRLARSGPGLHGQGSLLLALTLAVEGGERRSLTAK